MNRKDFLKTGMFAGLGLSAFSHNIAAKPNKHVRPTNSYTISEVKTYIHPKALFVKVTTKEGVSGWGEADHDNTKVIALIIQKLAKPILMGQDPFESEYLWHEILYQNEDLGLSGALSGALAGIDNALWDLKGKITNLPVYFIASTFNPARIQEYGGNRPEMGLGPYFENTHEFEDGYLHVPQGPGIGLIPNESLMAKLEFKQ